LKSIIISIYLCYYTRLIDQNTRTIFDNQLIDSFLELVNCDSNKNGKNEGKELISKIHGPFLKEYIQEELNNKFKRFSEVLESEQDFILENIELDEGIGKNKSLKENIFLLFISIITHIPLIIIGKPGSGKSLSSQLLYKSMRGKYSKKAFFRLFPSIIQSYFQGSNSTIPEDVEHIFTIAEGKLKAFKDKEEKEEELPISMILFDELGLAERSKYNPLKVLHQYFDYDGSKQGVSFVGISNWTLDAAKINRTLTLSVPDLEEMLDDLKITSISIAKSINEEFSNNQIFEDLLPGVYFNYKEISKELIS